MLIGLLAMHHTGLGSIVRGGCFKLGPTGEIIRQKPVRLNGRQLGAQAVQQIFAQRERPPALHIGDNEIMRRPGAKGRIGVLKLFERLQPCFMEGGPFRGDFQALVLCVEVGEQVAHLFDEFGLVLGDFCQVNLLLECLKGPQELQNLFGLAGCRLVIVVRNACHSPPPLKMRG